MNAHEKNIVYEGIRNLIQSPLFRWGLFIFCLSMVLYGNLRPTPPEQVFTHSDKAGHGISFFLLAVSAKLALFKVSPYWLWSALAAFSFVLEYFQGILRPLRTFSLDDAYANVFGVFLAMIFMAAWRLLAPDLLPVKVDPSKSGQIYKNSKS